MTSLYGYSCLSSSTVSADADLFDHTDDSFDRFVDCYMYCVMQSVESCNTISLSNIYLSLASQREWFPTRTRRLFTRLAEYFVSARFHQQWELFDESFREFLHRWCMEASCLVY